MAIISLLSFNSCKKDWTCACSVTYSNGLGGSNTIYPKYNLENKSHSDAQHDCEYWEGTYTSQGTAASCDLQ